MSSVGSHPSSDDLGAFLNGSLDPTTITWVEKHLGSCSRCSHTLDSLSSGDDEFNSKIKSIHDQSDDRDSFADASSEAEFRKRFRARAGSLLDSLPTVSISRQRYQLGDEIGRGGMGIVLHGSDSILNRELAFKVLDAADCENDEAVQRFVSEARICGSLQHPGIVPVHDMGRLGDRRPFFAMKRIEGRTLSQLLNVRTNATKDQAKFLGIFTQVCQTIAYAHAQDIIHRDLKPQNIMVGEFGEVQVMDWGLAKHLEEYGVRDFATNDFESPTSLSKINSKTESALSDNEPDLDDGTDGSVHAPLEKNAPRPELDRTYHTTIGKVLGTPAYMSPEQAQGRVLNVDKRSDVFALGSILCEILTGKSPYWRETTDSERVLQDAEEGNLTAAFRRLDAVCTDNKLVAFCKSCLAVERGDRPRDASLVANALVQHQESVADRLRNAELAEARANAQFEERRKRHRTILMSSLIVIGLLVALSVANSIYQVRARQKDLIISNESHRGNRLAKQLNAEKLALQIERDNQERRILLAGRHRGEKWNRILPFANTSLEDSPRAAVQKLNAELGETLHPMDQEFVRRLFEAHRWSVVDADQATREQCLIEAMTEYEDSFRVFAKWDSPGNLRSSEAMRLLRGFPRVVRAVVVDAMDDWIRIQSRLERNANLTRIDRFELPWLATVAGHIGTSDFVVKFEPRSSTTLAKNYCRSPRIQSLPNSVQQQYAS